MWQTSVAAPDRAIIRIVDRDLRAVAFGEGHVPLTYRV